MARKGRVDRGLLQRQDAAGKAVWYVRLWHEGKERRFGSFKNKTEARDFYEKAKQEQKAGRFFPDRYRTGGYESVQETLDHHMATNKNKGSAAEANYSRWWKDRLSGKRLNLITPALLEQAQRDLFDKEFSAQTVLHYLKFLRHVLNVAVRDGKLERNPFVHVKLPRVSAGRTRFLHHDEEGSLRTALGSLYGPWARLAILTGLRREEQFSLRWEQVDYERGIVTLPQTKAGVVQYVHLNNEATGILRGLDSWQRSVWVFPSQNPATHLDPRHFYARVFQPAVRRVGLEGVTWHTLRHTFASRLAMNGATEGTIATLLRHSSTALVRRYAHLSPSHLKAAVEGVASFGQAKKNGTNRVSQAIQGEVFSIPTVTGTGTGVTVENARDTEVSKNVGAPDRI